MAKILRFKCALGTSVPFGRIKDALAELKNPERTAYKSGAGFASGYTFQEWPNRASMARSIRMQESAGTMHPWKAARPLAVTEGY